LARLWVASAERYEAEVGCHMDVLVLGKSRYSTRRVFSDFLADGPVRGHSARLVGRKRFLESELRDETVVLAKSHYHDAAVQQHLRQAGALVINSLEATSRCRSRRSVAVMLRAAGVATPLFVEPGGAMPPLPWIVKPDGGDDHRLEVVMAARPVDSSSEFVQHFVLAERTMKVYVIGDCRHAVELFPKDPTMLDLKPRRADVDCLEESLAEAATRAGQACDLDVFNVDLVLHDGGWLVVDVNPFPRLEPVPGAASALWELVERCANSGRGSMQPES